MSQRKIKLRELLNSKGLLFSVDKQYVEEFEKANDINAESPKYWNNPIDIILNGREKLKSISVNTVCDVENLAAAARDGKMISDEVRKKMIEDRKNAKKK